mgnify:CR=1 FL=1
MSAVCDKKSGPIDATECNQNKIPDFVFDIFNRLIEERIGTDGVAEFYTSQVVDELKARKSYINKKWLDVISYYTEKGWTVNIVESSYAFYFPSGNPYDSNSRINDKLYVFKKSC